MQVGRLLPAPEAGRERKGAVILTAKEEKARPLDVLRHADSNCLMLDDQYVILGNSTHDNGLELGWSGSMTDGRLSEGLCSVDRRLLQAVLHIVPPPAL